MSEPLAYLIGWTTYGIWLHGDARGWVQDGIAGIQAPDPDRETEVRERMTGPPVTLDPEQRKIVNETIRAHCEFRGWQLHAVNARTNHVHVVVTAVGVHPDVVMNQFKAWCSRQLNEFDAARGRKRKETKWWTRHGSTKWINDEGYFHNAVVYVRDKQ